MHMLWPQYLENTTIFGDWVFNEVMKLNCDHEGEPESSMMDVLIRSGNLDTEKKIRDVQAREGRTL